MHTLQIGIEDIIIGELKMTIPHISTAHIHEITLFLQQTDNMQWCCNFRWSWSQNWVSIWLHYSVCNLKKRKLAINNKKKSARNFDCKLYMNKMRGKFMWQGWSNNNAW